MSDVDTSHHLIQWAPLTENPEKKAKTILTSKTPFAEPHGKNHGEEAKKKNEGK
jgi:hypothetical protein